MDSLQLEKNIPIFCLPVPSFPMGIKAAFETLYAMLPAKETRNYFGISYIDENGTIIYKAAASESFPGEAEKYGLEPFIIKKGNYKAESLMGWKSKTDQVKDVFMRLIQAPGFDNTYPCIEWYKTEEEMLCLVKLIH